MKLNPNVLAAAILGASIIIATLIYARIPQPYRYVYKEKETEHSLEHSVFDSATGKRYSCYIMGDLCIWSVDTPSDYVRLSKEQSRRNNPPDRADQP